jgi:uncharacterized protein
MLRPEDQGAIDDLFERLRNVEQNSAPRDRDAETLIAERLRQNPAAAYYMAQAIIVQEAALREQQARISELEEQGDRNRGGFLGGIFGQEEPRNRQPQPLPRQGETRRGPWDSGAQSGGGFLAGAAQTALGITGGILLGSAIAGMFNSPVQAEEANLEGEDPGADAGAEDGGDWGDGGDFDMGGEF